VGAHFIYTDGSQQNSITTFAITTETETLAFGKLPPYSSIQSAGILGILEALKIIQKMHGKFVICSDSLGSIEAIKNTQNNKMYPALIRSIPTKHYLRLKILWTPGH